MCTCVPVLCSAAYKNKGIQNVLDAVVDYLENEILRAKLSPTDVAGILVEPIQGEGGYVVPAPNFFKRLRALCDRYDILLIADEVMCGVGRCGYWRALEHDAVVAGRHLLNVGDQLDLADGLDTGSQVHRLDTERRALA